MNRTDKILRLVAVNFSATELSRQSTELLDATYEAAKPLMEAHEKEVNQVINRENKHTRRKRELIAQRQREQKLEKDWLRKWKPFPPICTVNTNIDQILTQIDLHRIEHEANKRLFRETGRTCYSDAANKALHEMRRVEGHYTHLNTGRAS